MSIGTWILYAYAPLNYVASPTTLTGREDGAAGELVAELRLERRLGPIAQTLRTGTAGRRLRAAKLLSAAGLAATAAGVRHNRAGSAIAGGALLVGSALTRFGLFAAGIESARDPRYTVQTQRARASR